jgi:hypothetical protein
MVNWTKTEGKLAEIRKSYLFDKILDLLDQFISLYAAKQITLWSTVLLEKLTVVDLVKNLHVFYGTQRFVTVFIKSHH